MSHHTLRLSTKHFKKTKKRISRILKRFHRPQFRLLRSSEAVAQGRSEWVRQLTQDQRTEYPQPSFIGAQPHSPASALPPLEWPGIALHRTRQACVIGNTNFVIQERVAIHPDLYVPERDRSPIELYGQGRMDSAFKHVRIPLGLAHGRLTKALSLCDQTPFNYAHWMTEILPRLALVLNQPELAGVPILADMGIADNLIQSVEALAGPGHELILLEPYGRLHVDELYQVSPSSYCPHEFRDFFLAQQQGFQFYFSTEALQTLRDRLRSRFARYAEGRPRHVYLKRTSLWTYNDRNIVNIDDVEDLIDDFGLETINVSGMNFAQQARIFMNAEFILAPTGAALTNMLFAKPGCRIVVMAASYQGATYDYFHQIAHALGHQLHFVVGPQMTEDRYHMNRNYLIDPAHLRLALQREFPASSGTRILQGVGSVAACR